jgi:hypothetical protein
LEQKVLPRTLPPDRPLSKGRSAAAPFVEELRNWHGAFAACLRQNDVTLCGQLCLRFDTHYFGVFAIDGIEQDFRLLHRAKICAIQSP